MDIKDITIKLIGNVKPVGESHTDENRLTNLIELCHLIEDLNSILFDIVIDNKNAHEYSIKQSRDYAKAFLIRQANNVNEYLEPK